MEQKGKWRRFRFLVSLRKKMMHFKRNDPVETRSICFGWISNWSEKPAWQGAKKQRQNCRRWPRAACRAKFRIPSISCWIVVEQEEFVSFCSWHRHHTLVSNFKVPLQTRMTTAKRRTRTGLMIRSDVDVFDERNVSNVRMLELSWVGVVLCISHGPSQPCSQPRKTLTVTTSQHHRLLEKMNTTNVVGLLGIRWLMM